MEKNILVNLRNISGLFLRAGHVAAELARLVKTCPVEIPETLRKLSLVRKYVSVKCAKCLLPVCLLQHLGSVCFWDHKKID